MTSNLDRCRSSRLHRQLKEPCGKPCRITWPWAGFPTRNGHPLQCAKYLRFVALSNFLQMYLCEGSGLAVFGTNWIWPSVGQVEQGQFVVVRHVWSVQHFSLIKGPRKNCLLSGRRLLEINSCQPRAKLRGGPKGQMACVTMMTVLWGIPCNYAT